MLRPPLRLLLYVDSFTQPRWVEWMLRQAVESGVASIAAVVVNESPADSAPRGNRFLRLARNWRALPYAAFLRYDERNGSNGTDPFEAADISAVVADARVIKVTPRRTKFSDYLSDEVIDTLRDLHCDVGLRLGFRILRGGALKVARHGIWSFHHGDNRAYRGGPPGFWEVVERAPYTGAILQRLSEDLDGGVVLFRTCVPTDPVSPNRNRRQLYWAAARGLVPTLRRLHEPGGLETVDGRVVPYGRRMYTAPSALRAALTCGALVTRRLTRRLRRRLDHQWRIALRVDALRAPSEPPELSPHRLAIVPAESGALEADPFVVTDGDGYLLFFERIAPGGARGEIAVRRVDRKGVVGESRIVLAPDHHLSYPTLFQWEGVWYLVPESYAAGAQEVYRATAFPDAWTLHDRWFEGEPVVDPSIVEHDGRWWLFASRPVPQTLVGDELHLFHAPSPLGPWTPHTLNPVRSGVDGSRPAGLPFRALNRLVRPGQLGAPHYGAGVMLFEILELSPDQYRERPLGEITPDWSPNISGFHTINASGHLTVGDVLVAPGRERDPAH